MKTLFLLFFLSAISAFGQLTWATTKVELQATTSDQEVTGIYGFKNDTAKTIKIKAVKTSCGCTTAKLEKKVYAPGESGQIEAHFDIGSRLGLQSKTIFVTTDDAPKNPVVLELSVNIPDFLEIENSQLVWKIGDKPNSQMFSLKAREGYKIKVTEVRCSNDSFRAEIATAKEGQQYHIAVTPTKMDKKAFSLLIVTTDYPPHSPRVVYCKLVLQ